MLNIKEFCDVIGGNLIIQGLYNEINDISIYPIKIYKFDTFFAINSKKYSNSDGGFGNTGNEDSVYGLGGVQDGHMNIQEVVLSGAKTIVYDEDTINFYETGKINYIKVSDTVEALAKYAKFIIGRNKTKVIGITGSTGKTTLANIIYDVLSVKYKVSKVNYIRTTFLGLAWYIINKLSNDADFLIIEMQSDGIGQIEKYCEIVRLDYAFVVNINYSHLKRFGSLENILNEKLAVYRGLKEDGKLFLNIDNEILYNWYQEQKDDRIITVGLNSSADVYCEDFKNVSQKLICNINIDRKLYLRELEILYRGKQSIYGVLFSAGLLTNLHYSYEDIENALSNIKSVVGRFQSFKGVNNSLVIIDSYNASYESTIFGIEYLSNLKQSRKILIIGSLLELSEKSESVHRSIGKFINEKNSFEYIIAIGESTLYILDELITSKIRCFHSFSYEEVVNFLRNLKIDSNTAVYIKGSGAMRLEIIALYLLSQLTEC